MVSQNEVSRHTGIPINTYTLMHADEVVAIVKSHPSSIDLILPDKLPFGLRLEYLDSELFKDWLNRRVGNLQRPYMNKVYMARKVGRALENVLRDSCALAITDKFWINRSDIDMTWAKLQALRDQNEVLANVALSGNTVKLDWEAARQGTTSLFTTKGFFPKAIMRNKMLKCGGTQEREWVASFIGKALSLPVQNVEILYPSVNGRRGADGSRLLERLPNTSPFTVDHLDDTLVSVDLFTSDKLSLVHASELHPEPGFTQAHTEGNHHRYFYDCLPTDEFKREFERVLILNWLISNHDMHGENFGCLYNPDTFETVGVTPSFDHNSADFDGTMPELDVPDIIKSSIRYHPDVVEKLESGCLEEILAGLQNWLTPEQKDGVRAAARDIVSLYYA